MKSGPDSNDLVDIAIIGGGVAGSSLAIVMQRAGWRTVIIEREPAFRDRIRGEACHPWGVRELMELGLTPFVDQIGGLELPSWTRYQDQREELTFEWDDVFPVSPPEIGFSHPDLQEALLEGAAREGARVFRPARTTVIRDNGYWELQINHGHRTRVVQARFLVAADGKNSTTRKLWGGETITDPVNHSFGGMLVKDIDLSQSSAHQGFHDAGFSMLFPQGQDRWRVYLVCPNDAARTYIGSDRVQRYLRACGDCFPKGAFEQCTPAGSLAFFTNAHVLTSKIDGASAVAIGDAAGAADPSQGHGMSLVWRDVRELRDLLLAEDLADVPSAFARRRRAYEHVLRTHAAWVAALTTGSDSLSVALRAQVDMARSVDPTALGYTGIFANGPDSLPTDDAARAVFFGEHLTKTPIRIVIPLDKFG